VRFFKPTLVVAFLFVPGFVHADVNPTLSIRNLVDSSDLIIVGTVERVQKTGAGSVVLSARDYERLDFQAEIRVDETIKGETAVSRFILNYSTPSADNWGNVANGSLEANTHGVVFLQKTAQGYAFENPYTPFLATTPKSCGPNWRVKLGEDAYHKVLQRLLAVLCMPSSPGEKNWALARLNWDEDSSAAPFLKAALGLPEIQSDAVARTSILSDLLAWKDLSVLPLAEQELFDPSRRTPGYLKSNLVLGMSRLGPQLSVPLLARALKLTEPEGRVAAARFLEYTNSQDAIDVLLTDLDDPDREVQFAVMTSLGNLTNQHWWRPRTLDLDSHWSACIEHWREFEAQRNTNLEKK